MKGYTESLSAGQLFVWAMMLGLVKYLNVGDFNLDVVPVDYVSNMIIAATSKLGQSPTGSFFLYHCTSTDMCPCNFSIITGAIRSYVRTNASINQAQKPSITVVNDKKTYEALQYMTIDIPMLVMEKYANLPYLGN